MLVQNQIKTADKKMKRIITFVIALLAFGAVVFASETMRDKSISTEFLKEKLAQQCPEFKRKCGNNQEQFCRKYYQKCISNFDGVKEVK